MSQITLEPETRSKSRSMLANLFATYHFDSSQFPLPLKKYITNHDFEMFLGEVNGILEMPYYSCVTPSATEKWCMKSYKNTKIGLVLIAYLVLLAISVAGFTGVWFIPNWIARGVILSLSVVLFIISMFVVFFRLFLVGPTRSGLMKCEEERLEGLKALVRERNQYFEPKGVQFMVHIKEQERTLVANSDRRTRDAYSFLTKAPTLIVYLSGDAPLAQQPQHSANVAVPQPHAPVYNGGLYGGASYGVAPPAEKQEPVQYQQPGQYYGSYQ